MAMILSLFHGRQLWSTRSLSLSLFVCECVLAFLYILEYVLMSIKHIVVFFLAQCRVVVPVDEKDASQVTGLLSCSYVLSFVQKCHVKNKDIRKFLDGIYVSEKGTVVEEEWGERFQLHLHGGSSVQASFFNIWVFKKNSSITSVGYLLEFLFLEVLLCYGIAFVFSCYALGAQKCLTVSIHSRAAFPKKNCSIFACESSATLQEFEFNCSETRCLWRTS